MDPITQAIQQMNAVAVPQEKPTFKVGEEIVFNGVKMTVVVVNSYSLVVRPVEASLAVKGIPMHVHKMAGNIIVLKPDEQGGKPVKLSGSSL